MASRGTTLQALQHDHILTHSVSTAATISDIATTSGNIAPPAPPPLRRLQQHPCAVLVAAALTRRYGVCSPRAVSKIKFVCFLL